jgi:hypothetical protein
MFVGHVTNNVSLDEQTATSIGISQLEVVVRGLFYMGITVVS